MAARIRKREISPVELLDAHLENIAALNPRLNAIIELRTERARQEARAAEAAVMRGGALGPLHGVPVTIKSSIDVAGLRSETGSRLRQGMVAAKDAPLVERLKAAGAIVLGNTNVPELLMAWETDNLLYGATRNPWDLERTPGGSSGGESAAIAACLSAGGVGSDGGGSIRVPAHFTGICGLKPTPGRIPATGHFPEGVGPFAPLGVVGPMARTVADLELLFAAMAGFDAGDTMSAPVPLRKISADELRQVRIGYFEDDGVVPVTAETRAAVRAAADALRKQGFKVAAVKPAYLEKARENWWNIFVRLGGELISPLFEGRDEDLSAVLRDFLETAAREPQLSKAGLLDSWVGRDRARLEMMAEMAETPILLAPVCAVPAFRHGERAWTIAGQRVEYLHAMRYTAWFNLLGNPAASVPVAASGEGLPIGVQIVGRPYEDELVMAVAGAVERDFGYREPPLLREALTLGARG